MRQVERVVLSRYDIGIDYGSERVLLARDSTGRQLWWQRGGKYWAGILSGSQPFPASLVLHKATMTGTLSNDRTLHEGGRLSKRLLERYRIPIDLFFGRLITDHLHPRQTLEIE